MTTDTPGLATGAWDASVNVATAIVLSRLSCGQSMQLYVRSLPDARKGVVLLVVRRQASLLAAVRVPL